MRKWTRNAGLLFLAVSSVYFGELTWAAPAKSANSSGGTDVRLLEDLSEVPAAAQPASQPVTQGQSVTASEVNVSDTGTVEIHVNDANLLEVLRMLSLQSQKNIVASKEVRGTVTANLYNVTVREALDAILHANGYAYREKGNFIYVYTAREMAEIEKAERKTVTEVFRLYYTPAANAVTMIKPVLSAAGQTAFTTAAAVGLDAGAQNVGGNSHAVEDTIVVTDYPENIEQVRKVLKDVDRRPQQILIEATILRASLSEDNALGVDFNVVGGVDFNSFVSNNGQITSGGLGDAVLGDTLSSVGTGTNFTQGINGFRVGVISNNVSVFLSALEQVTDTTVLANPKVLALNKQQGEVIVGRKDGYYTTTVTESATVQTVEFLDTGTRLIFRPYIGDDGYIRMEIHPEDSSGGLQADSNLPFKVTTEVTSNVMIKDGHTIMIGGLFREDSSAARSQIPVLGNIPWAGALFRRERDRTTREEVIILLTPHIVKDDVAYSQSSAEMLQEADRLRVGVRKGMMPWGRERMADWCYQQAQEELSKPRPNRHKAIWHLDCATNLNPKFLEAIELKEQLTGREVTTADNSGVRTFLRRQVLIEQVPASADDPATAPALPATQPTTGPVVIAPVIEAEPQVQPSDEAVPTTQPIAEAAPASQPVAELQPAPQPVAVEAEPQVLEVLEVIEVVTTPSTAPAEQDAAATSVTELPLEVIDGAAVPSAE